MLIFFWRLGPKVLLGPEQQLIDLATNFKPSFLCEQH